MQQRANKMNREKSKLNSFEHSKQYDRHTDFMMFLRISHPSKSSTSPEVTNKIIVERRTDAQGVKTVRTLVFSNSSQARSEPVRAEYG